MKTFTAILNACHERYLAPSQASITFAFEVAIHNAIQLYYVWCGRSVLGLLLPHKTELLEACLARGTFSIMKGGRTYEKIWYAAT